MGKREVAALEGILYGDGQLKGGAMNRTKFDALKEEVQEQVDSAGAATRQNYRRLANSLQIQLAGAAKTKDRRERGTAIRQVVANLITAFQLEDRYNRISYGSIDQSQAEDLLSALPTAVPDLDAPAAPRRRTPSNVTASPPPRSKPVSPSQPHRKADTSGATGAVNPEILAALDPVNLATAEQLSPIAAKGDSSDDDFDMSEMRTVLDQARVAAATPDDPATTAATEARRQQIRTTTDDDSAVFTRKQEQLSQISQLDIPVDEVTPEERFALLRADTRARFTELRGLNAITRKVYESVIEFLDSPTTTEQEVRVALQRARQYQQDFEARQQRLNRLSQSFRSRTPERTPQTSNTGHDHSQHNTGRSKEQTQYDMSADLNQSIQNLADEVKDLRQMRRVTLAGEDALDKDPQGRKKPNKELEQDMANDPLVQRMLAAGIISMKDIVKGDQIPMLENPQTKKAILQRLDVLERQAAGKQEALTKRHAAEQTMAFQRTIPNTKFKMYVPPRYAPAGTRGAKRQRPKTAGAMIGFPTGAYYT
jgi:hypothetical protein